MALSITLTNIVFYPDRKSIRTGIHGRFMLRSILLFTLFFLYLSTDICSQNSKITGKVIDKESGESLIGVAIMLDESTGTLSDIKGNYSLSMQEGNYQITFSYVGYEKITKPISIGNNQIITLDIALEASSALLDEVVISASRFEQKLSDVAVSMEIIKPDLIEAKNTTNIETAIQQVPGILIMDGQASIRGGSGYSYGAGSRVLLLVDDLPMMTAASGEIKWDFIPIENLEQIEIIKGASSVLFGSSALNGVIHVRTAYPRNKPELKVILNSGIYDKPSRKEIQWWSKGYQTFSGGQISYSRKIGNLDISAGSHILMDNGYRQRGNNERYRFNINTR